MNTLEQNHTDQQEQNLQRRIERLETLYANKIKELDKFAYIASHDLKEPLNTILSFAKILKAGYADKLDERGEKCIHYIDEAVLRLIERINALRSLSKVGRDIVLDEVNILDIVRHSIENLEQENPAFKAEFELPENKAIVGPETELILFFEELIRNAQKFQDPASSPSIKISVQENAKYHLISVQDNGIGIPEKHYEKIFELFQQLHNRGDYPGIGTGLTKCKKVAELHNGFLEVQSTLGEGSTFTLGIDKSLSPTQTNQE